MMNWHLYDLAWFRKSCRSVSKMYNLTDISIYWQVCACLLFVPTHKILASAQMILPIKHTGDSMMLKISLHLADKEIASFVCSGTSECILEKQSFYTKCTPSPPSARAQHYPNKVPHSCESIPLIFLTGQVLDDKNLQERNLQLCERTRIASTDSQGTMKHLHIIAYKMDF